MKIKQIAIVSMFFGNATTTRSMFQIFSFYIYILDLHFCICLIYIFAAFTSLMIMCIFIIIAYNHKKHNIKSNVHSEYIINKSKVYNV